ncbi:unnamed protein product, partial [Allacma fusca]
THKMKKLELQQQGFDIAQFSDPVFFFDGDKFTVLNPLLFAAIMEGKIRMLWCHMLEIPMVGCTEEYILLFLGNDFF